MNFSELGLWVYHHEQLIGRLHFDPQTDEFSFVYDTNWLSGKNFLLSPHIHPEHQAKGVVTRFLENLLPEGQGLQHLAQMLKANPSNLYALISAIGLETTGALTLLSDKDVKPATHFREVKLLELEKRIHERQNLPITNWDGKPRLSLAGVQEKLPITIRDGTYGLGEGNIASTHILKFGNQQSNHLVINEYFCMKLAEGVGLNVPQCRLLEIEERVLVVERFDRIWEANDFVRRVHVIDGCQALDLRPQHKYERFLGDSPQVADIRGPATLRNIYDFCAHTNVPAQARLSLIQWVFFNLIIGNSDHHVKNISFYIKPEEIQLAPFYDLVSVAMYPNFEQALAFNIGDSFARDELGAYNFAEMASELGLAKRLFATQLHALCKKIKAVISELDVIDASVDEKIFLKDLKTKILSSCDRFLLISQDIPKFPSV